MSSPFESPLVRYGIAFSDAAVVALVGREFFDGTAQLVAYLIAALGLVVTPQILKAAT